MGGKVVGHVLSHVCRISELLAVCDLKLQVKLQPITKAIITLIKVKLKIRWTLLYEHLKSDLCFW